MLFVCPEEGGIVLEAALYAGFCGQQTGSNLFLCKKQPLDGDIFPDRCSGSLLKKPQKMGLADIKPLGEHLQRKLIGQVVINVFDDGGSSAFFR